MKNIKKFYNKLGKNEWQRLIKSPFNELEFTTSLIYLKKYLPKKGTILDAGGGPGRYTIELAKKGHTVTLLDYSPELLKIATQKIKKAKVKNRVNSIIEGDIRDLSNFKDKSFDAVICLGAPRSHVTKSKDRLKAVMELKRVAKKGAPIFISVIGRLGVLTTALWKFPDEIGTPRYNKYRDTGDYKGNYGFTAAHFFLAEDLKKLIIKSGLKPIKMIGLEGLASANEPIYNNLSKSIRKRLLNTHFKTCELPAVVDTSNHMMIITKK